MCKREWLKGDVQDFINRSKYKMYISSIQQSNEDSIEFFVITKSWRLKDHSMWVFRKNSMEFFIGLDYLLILLLQVAVPY